MVIHLRTDKKVPVGKDQEKVQSEKKIPTPKTEMGKTKLTIKYYAIYTYR